MVHYPGECPGLLGESPLQKLHVRVDPLHLRMGCQSWLPLLATCLDSAEHDGHDIACSGHGHMCPGMHGFLSTAGPLGCLLACCSTQLAMSGQPPLAGPRPRELI